MSALPARSAILPASGLASSRTSTERLACLSRPCARITASSQANVPAFCTATRKASALQQVPSETETTVASSMRTKSFMSLEPFPRTSAFQRDCHSIASTISSGRKTMMLAGSVRRIVAALVALTTMAVATHAEDVNDYPTSARVEYVFGCLKANGETRQAIEQCSCSIDVVASIVPYARYVTAETVLSMSQVQGNLGGQFRTSEQAASALNELRRAQAEAEVRCF